MSIVLSARIRDGIFNKNHLLMGVHLGREQVMILSKFNVSGAGQIQTHIFC